MKTKTIKLYEFDELPEAIKAKVIERNRDINTDYDWSSLTLDEWEKKLEEHGFNNPTISYSGFWSQGDGASFVCTSVDVDKFVTSQKARGRFNAILKAIKAETVDVNVSIRRIDHHYSHEYTVTAESEIVYYRDEEPKNYAQLETEEGELRGMVLEVARTLSRQIYKELEAEYEALTADSEIIETIKANEYTFRADGTMENE
jgi:hypothetical protein